MKEELKNQLAKIKPISETSEQELAQEQKQYVPSKLVQRFLGKQSRKSRENDWLVVNALHSIYEQQNKPDDLFDFPFAALDQTGLDRNTMDAVLERLGGNHIWIIEIVSFIKMKDPTGNQPFVWHPATIDNPYNAPGVSPKIRIAKPKAFKSLFSKLRAEFQQMPTISYDEQTGVGYADEKRFRFRNDKDAFKIFPLMFKNIGTPIGEEAIRATLNLQGAGFTERVNQLAKDMRRLTRLSTDYIVYNNKSLTLIGNKENSFPKSP